MALLIGFLMLRRAVQEYIGKIYMYIKMAFGFKLPNSNLSRIIFGIPSQRSPSKSPRKVERIHAKILVLKITWIKRFGPVAPANEKSIVERVASFDLVPLRSRRLPVPCADCEQNSRRTDAKRGRNAAGHGLPTAASRGTKSRRGDAFESTLLLQTAPPARYRNLELCTNASAFPSSKNTFDCKSRKNQQPHSKQGI